MTPPDGFTEQYMEHFDGTYDSVDRILLNAVFPTGSVSRRFPLLAADADGR